MRIRSMTRHSMFATGLMLAFAAAPFTSVAAHGAPMQKASDNQTVPDKAADAWITTKVKSEFAASKNIKAGDISVSSNDGVVTLSGTVATPGEKLHAERVAQRIKGVKHVDASGLTVSAMPVH